MPAINERGVALSGDKDTSIHAERYPMPLNGGEIVEIVAKIAMDALKRRLALEQDLNEAKAFSRAEIRFGFGLEIALYPQEEGRKVSVNAEIELLPHEFPPDVLRILTGEQIWDQVDLDSQGSENEQIDQKIDPKPALKAAVEERFAPKLEEKISPATPATPSTPPEIKPTSLPHPRPAHKGGR